MQITEPTPVQEAAIPALLAGRDLVGQSATGSGKTLAYGIPVIERLTRERRVVQALILVPTRELAVQVNTVLSKLASRRRLSTALLVGGRAYNAQISALRYGSQIVVGTPGRVKDHIERGSLVLNQVRMCILDEADQMLDSGFAPIIEEILSTMPEKRQMALFSATMPEWIIKLQQKYLQDPVTIDISSATGAPETIEQITYQIPHDKKMAALSTLLRSTQGESTLIFGRTKFGVEKLGKQLGKLGFAVGTLHGNKSQRAREEVLTAFRRGQVQTLLATDVAARGLDIQGIYQVINYELPESSDLFTHRIGRTGRMGRSGKAITLLIPSDMPKWRRMARNLGQAVALRPLAIDDEALTTVSTTPEPLVEHQQSQPAPIDDRQNFSREYPPKFGRENQPAGRPKQRQRDRFSQEPERQRNRFSQESERQRNYGTQEPERQRERGIQEPERQRNYGAQESERQRNYGTQEPERQRERGAQEPARYAPRRYSENPYPSERPSERPPVGNGRNANRGQSRTRPSGNRRNTSIEPERRPQSRQRRPVPLRGK